MSSSSSERRSIKVYSAVRQRLVREKNSRSSGAEVDVVMIMIKGGSSKMRMREPWIKIPFWIVAVILFLKWEYTNIKLHKNITKVCYIKYGLQYSLENEEGLVSLGGFYKSWSANQKSELMDSGFWLVDWKVTCRDVSRWGTELCRMYLWQFGTSSFNWGDYRCIERRRPRPILSRAVEKFTGFCWCC